MRRTAMTKAIRLSDRIIALTERLLKKRFSLTLREAIAAQDALAKELCRKTGRAAVADVKPARVIDCDCSYDWIRYNALKSILTAYSEMMNARIWAIGLKADDFTGVGAK